MLSDGIALELGITAALCSLIDYMGRSVRCLIVRLKWFFVKYGKPYQKKWRPTDVWGDKSILPPMKFTILVVSQKLTATKCGI